MGRSVADVLLEPTRIYVRSIQKLLESVEVRAMAHVTGGGLTGNVPRVLPTGAVSDLPELVVRPARVRGAAQGRERDDAEMFGTFNMASATS